MCRYLFVRCDNEPAPWTRFDLCFFPESVLYLFLLFDGSCIFLIIYCSDEHGDRPRPLPDVPELENATDLFVRKESPSWGFDVSKVSLLYEQSRYRIFFGWFIIL